MNQELTAVRVNRKGADRIESGHPWIFSSDVTDRSEASPGDAVRVIAPGGRALGMAHYSSTSQIALRLLSRHVEPIDRLFFLRRISAAEEHRRRIVQGTDAYRIVFGEADLLPGLVVDRYGDYLVAQTLDQGMDRAAATILECLVELFSPAGIVVRNDVRVRKHEALPLESHIARGTVPECVAIHMNGLSLEADLLTGQKTGVYLDQRENYLAAMRYARGKALDCFTSTGGFALHLAKTCESVLAIDSSEPALEVARRNATLNKVGNVHFESADVFDWLSSHGEARFSTIVLDPPAFAKSRSAVEGAARGYKEINYRALRMLAPDGVLVTCSCSHHMSESMLLEVIASAALDAGRTLRVLERRAQAGDHPILLTTPETHYLKCLILECVR